MIKPNHNPSLQISLIKNIFLRSIITSFFTSLLSCVILVSYLIYPQGHLLLGQTNQIIKDVSRHTNPRLGHYYTKERLQTSQKKNCNIFDGRWVYDKKAYPMYEPSKCPFISDQVSCRRNGRPDLDYEKWRWEASECLIPRFNATNFLERLRGKRLIFVGDSLNRNQWESLSCLLYSSIRSNSVNAILDKKDYKIFIAKDYNCTVEYHFSPFLIEYKRKSVLGRLLNLDRLPISAQKWKGADIMVFNTGHWWNTGRWYLMRYKGTALENVTTERGLDLAMKTWGRWVDRNVDGTKTIVFFRTISPPHNKGVHWCHNQTLPIKKKTFNGPFAKSTTKTVERRIRNMKTSVKYLNITRLSLYRKDAHQSVYTTRKGVLLTEEQRKKPEKFADCLHWCIPGLPDTWNQLLYTSILLQTSPGIF